jgi:AraC-like DNA-binding protein
VNGRVWEGESTIHQPFAADFPAYIAAMHDPYREPEEAIGCFEHWSGLAVTVHDLVGALEPHLRPLRGWHTTRICQAMKSSDLNPRCMRWDVERLRTEIGRFPQGRIQVCHAGLLELVVPVQRAGALELLLFAGQRTAPAGIEAVRDQLSEGARLLAGSADAPEISASACGFALEGLRQLGARLARWLDAMQAPPPASRLPAPSNRQHAIMQFILAEHARSISLADLARHLRLSRHRAAHAVREVCGRTFVELLTEARLRSAGAMLDHTELTVAEVATRSGFGDPDHFHRVFRRHLGFTPGAFRRRPGRGP